MKNESVTEKLRRIVQEKEELKKLMNEKKEEA
jgi:hypothetical protein